MANQPNKRPPLDPEEVWTHLARIGPSPRETRALRKAVQRYRLTKRLGCRTPKGLTAEEIIERVAPYREDHRRWHQLVGLVCDLAALEERGRSLS